MSNNLIINYNNNRKKIVGKHINIITDNEIKTKIQNNNQNINVELTKDKLVEYIINPIKIDKNNQDINQKYNEISQEYKTGEQLNEWWRTKTNQPYKPLLKNVPNVDVNCAEHLVVHKITKDDKNVNIFNKELETMKDEITKQNNVLNSIYSKSNYLEFKKNFEYINKNTTKYDPNVQITMPKDININKMLNDIENKEMIEDIDRRSGGNTTTSAIISDDIKNKYKKKNI